MRNRFLFLALFTLLLAAGILYAGQMYSNMLSQNKPIVVIIGDSNSDPNSITDVQKWSQDYAAAHQQDQVVVNLSLGGHAVEDFNTNDTYQQLLAVAKSAHSNTPIVVITLLGTNNAIMMNKLDTPEQFTINYGNLLVQIEQILHPKAFLIASIPPAYPQEGNPVPYTPNFKAYKLIDQFNVAVGGWVATTQKINHSALRFVSIMPKASYSATNISTYFIADGIHLNRSTQKIVYDNITPAIEELLESK